MKVFPYYWYLDEKETEFTCIEIYCLDKNNKTVVLRVDDFTPYVYLELDNRYKWTAGRSQSLIDSFESIVKPVKTSLVYKKKLYFYQGTKKFPYLLLAFNNYQHVKKFSWKISGKTRRLVGVGAVKCKVHEQNANPILQLTCAAKISMAGWFEFSGKEVSLDNKITHADKEFQVSWRKLKPVDDDSLPQPKVMSMDIEVNSTNPSRMPDSKVPGDKVFQISCVVFNEGSENDSKKYLLTLGNPYTNIVGESVTVMTYKTEADLLMGYSRFVTEQRVNVVIGYNILGFDNNYMKDRAIQCKLEYFDVCGFSKYKHSEEKSIKWSSSAYKDQIFEFLDIRGVLHIDLLPLVRRDYKFDTYKLSNVASNFLSGETKDPMDHKGIFRGYRQGIEAEEKNASLETQKIGRTALGLVGKYCVQDSVLVAKLFGVLQSWTGLCMMSQVCKVSIFTLYTQGQQIKVYSQVYSNCMYEGRVVEKDGYIPNPDETYEGATVLDPKRKGLFENVVPMDFSSLYPSTIISNNISHDTLVIDESIPDEECHIIEWETHKGCSHDKTIRTVKIKSKDVICGVKHKYRFIKKPEGVIPLLLRNLLDARKVTKNEIKKYKNVLKDMDDNAKKSVKGLELQKLLIVLDKRQLAFKVSANSVYGAMGVKRGYLPFMPGAMCTTAQGRNSLHKAMGILEKKFQAYIVYGDTDSCYCIFDKVKGSQKLWDHCLHIEDEVSKEFPPPMRLAFEEVIYPKFFILTKKRYMYQSCGRDGVKTSKIGTKGVLLARRDNSAFIRRIYETVITMIFNKKEWCDVHYYLCVEFNKLCSGVFPLKDFIITKSVGDEKNYVVRPLPDDVKKRKKRLLDLQCDEKEYRLKSLPAHVQLANKMRTRGQRVDPGSRLEIIVTTKGGLKCRLFNKMEDPKYFKEFPHILKIEYLYYLDLLSNSLDQLLEAAFHQENGDPVPEIVKFTSKHYKLRSYKQLINDTIRELGSSELIFEKERIPKNHKLFKNVKKKSLDTWRGSDNKKSKIKTRQLTIEDVMLMSHGFNAGI